MEYIMTEDIFEGLGVEIKLNSEEDSMTKH